MRTSEDRLGNEIGNGNYHVSYTVYQIDGVFTEVQESETTESVYVFFMELLGRARKKRRKLILWTE